MDALIFPMKDIIRKFLSGEEGDLSVSPVFPSRFAVLSCNSIQPHYHAMPILNTGFTKYSGPNLMVRTKTIITCLSEGKGLEYFPNPSPSLAALTIASGKFLHALSLGNAPGAAEARVNARTPLVAMLNLLATNLEDTAKGNRVMLAHTGFILRKEYHLHNSPLDAPQELRAKHTGHPGEAALQFRAVARARSYEAQWTHDIESGIWHSGTPCSNSRKLLFKGLERGKDTWFRVRAIGKDAPGPWSDATVMMVV